MALELNFEAPHESQEEVEEAALLWWQILFSPLEVASSQTVTSGARADISDVKDCLALRWKHYAQALDQMTSSD